MGVQAPLGLALAIGGMLMETYGIWERKLEELVISRGQIPGHRGFISSPTPGSCPALGWNDLTVQACSLAADWRAKAQSK